MLSSEEILERAAEDGSIDISEWPRVLESLLQRLHDIVHNEFPIPSIPPPQPAISEVRRSVDLDPAVVASTPPPQLPTSETSATNTDADADIDSDSERPSNSQSSTKENDAPTDIAAGRPPYPHAYDISDSQRTEERPPPPPPQFAPPETQQGALPPELLSMYQQSTRLLQYDFAESPPYTIQRLAEMALRPKKHYRFLPAYLRALDRIVSVNSPVSDFPLPALHTPINGGFLTNGDAQVNGISEREGLGSDESLGGALLTPIPWLRNQQNALGPTPAAPESQGELHSESTETIEGPHGAGSIETVTVTVNGISSATASQPSSSPIASPTLSEQSDASSSSSASTDTQLREQGGVTQGELLRQEQEAGVVPVSTVGQPMTPRRSMTAGGAAAVGREPIVGGVPMDEGMEEEVHARGPDVIGMEDTGPQPISPPGQGHVLDMEAAVGRGRSKSPQPPPVKVEIKDEMEDVELAEPGKPGKDPKDVEKAVEKLKEAMDAEVKAEAKDSDGDVIVADVDGKPVDTDMKEEQQA
ncbi:uncharacterized protein MYCFIDRAFT_215143 [Pseudocercospora fijiensis CIRAD86]|uniref:Protein phosphatase 4 core regulatory subunit R2 n=1 Tax=Pseudocercospora fijiensis (strain CIRAD86) TaxID=383855 RepID=M3B0L0_PSEFD|nr:uncharacterized protein MYCFIDRAFT_215143 [Pseudocercospora fijiensis CIRAD86]EME82948.1 hypothetical protein MYCFIDRAFT_215143 [Pseudocercospora fijiensis CIRAD86]